MLFYYSCYFHGYDKIEISKGKVLAARAWIPDEKYWPVPSVIEILPYGKRYGTCFTDETTHPVLASNGFATFRIDIRGTNDSIGFKPLADEYSWEEFEDIREIIKWLVFQPWTMGAFPVGIIGKSWGGFNGLWMAAQEDAAIENSLGAVIAVCASDSRYFDDVHMMGGALMTDNPSWGAFMLRQALAPADPLLVGIENSDEETNKRIRHLRPMFFKWMSHLNNDKYWHRGSVIDKNDIIKVPLWVVGGWADSYTNAVPRLLKADSGKKTVQALVGPWSHNYPHLATPGPAIDWMKCVVEYFNTHLRGMKVPSESILNFNNIFWMQEWTDPAPFQPLRNGRWVSLAADDCIVLKNFYVLADGNLVDESDFVQNAASLYSTAYPEIKSNLTDGVDCGRNGYGSDPDHPMNQAAEDGKAPICVTSAPLQENFEILGTPTINLRLSSTEKRGILVARLCDVSPDGSSLLVSIGVINLCSCGSGSFANPAFLIPGLPFEVNFELNFIAHSFRAGNRIRLCLGTSLWPVIWPVPDNPRLIIETINSIETLPKLILPCFHEKCPISVTFNEAPEPPKSLDLNFVPPRAMNSSSSTDCINPPRLTELRRSAPASKLIQMDITNGKTVLKQSKDYGQVTDEITGITTDETLEETFEIFNDDPLSFKATIVASLKLLRSNAWLMEHGFTRLPSSSHEHLQEFLACLNENDWSCDTTCEVVLTCDSEYFHTCLNAKVSTNNGTFSSKTRRNWRQSFPRNFC